MSLFRLSRYLVLLTCLFVEDMSWGVVTENFLNSTSSNSSKLQHEIYLKGSINTLQAQDAKYSTYGSRFVFNYFLTEKLATEVAYANLSDVQNGSSLWDGFDIGGRWYLFSSGARLRQNLKNTTLDFDSSFNHYVLGLYRTRTIHGQVDVSYGGYGVGYGLNMVLMKYGRSDVNQVWLTLEASVDRFTGYDRSTIRATNVETGLGFRL
ncbi:MAG: hypothetical protein NT027_06675 [Proteobacteria bacterium]|nr:hypothetical protein [Pseudomonadota bacterium]